MVAETPPMGWNSWDCYGTSVTEEELLENARYMRDHLKRYGWRYVVCDIQWYEPTADSTGYHDFVPLRMDGHSRLIPAENRFPSSRGGKGFGPIADEIHAMDLKFGIHIMRGIPRQAVHQDCAILGTAVRARSVAQRFSVCSWNTDMYGLAMEKPGAQEYYDSIFSLYASWGVDFVKVDDICHTYFKPDDPYSAKAEIEAIRKAIDKCGREIVLSLSPGPAPRSQAEHLAKNANMWRISGDFWDDWEDLKRMFSLCKEWQGVSKPGSWPDCDMIPFGHISLRGCERGLGERMTRLTHDEQITLMTLWCLFRSPLFFGGNLPDNDAWTEKLLTNEDVLAVHRSSLDARLVSENPVSVWLAEGEGYRYTAFCNLSDECVTFDPSLSGFVFGNAENLWEKTELAYGHPISLPPHGSALFASSLSKESIK